MHVVFNGGAIKASRLAHAHRTLYANARIDDGPGEGVRRMRTAPTDRPHCEIT